MLANALAELRNFFHAQLCYQLFITPLPLPVEKEYREFAQKACDFLVNQRTSFLVANSPRHHVIHRFAQESNENAKKVLITHGWMSRAAYMARLIHALHKQGYDVYALDFPAHGEAKGLQLTWIDAVNTLKTVINHLGPFYGAIGHSFGGSMLLNTLNLACQLPEWELESIPERAVLISSPTNMRTPVSKHARRFKLNGKGYLRLREVIRQNSKTNITHLNFRNFINRGTTPILCIHGTEDISIPPRESIEFCRHYPHASLALLAKLDHINVLIDERVEQMVMNFLL
ncbi:putative hydrolase [Legionella busanensis]|uniref:Putative hydrolase n=1 Tax=Legionella busanensis TaxID=190655 RepID=A0A378JGR2_9GAMM|nr:alpha/beta fold hydrolase [Legionella busanensis]STX50365.1 putative hydrolase [Legionella busanensis]